MDHMDHNFFVKPLNNVPVSKGFTGPHFTEPANPNPGEGLKAETPPTQREETWRNLEERSLLPVRSAIDAIKGGQRYHLISHH